MHGTEISLEMRNGECFDPLRQQLLNRVDEAWHMARALVRKAHRKVELWLIELLYTDGIFIFHLLRGKNNVRLMLCYYKTDYSELFTLTGEHCCKIAYPEKFTFS